MVFLHTTPENSGILTYTRESQPSLTSFLLHYALDAMFFCVTDGIVLYIIKQETKGTQVKNEHSTVI